MDKWHVYILRCGGGRLYTGITNDIKRRLAQHKSGNGARFTRSFGVIRLCYKDECPTRSQALKREAQIKRLTKKEKLALIRESGKAVNMSSP